MAYRIFYTPQDPYNDDGGDTFITLEVMVTVFFSLELLIRMVAGGALLSRTGFFAWPRNTFDLLLVLTTIAALSTAKVSHSHCLSHSLSVSRSLSVSGGSRFNSNMGILPSSDALFQILSTF